MGTDRKKAVMARLIDRRVHDEGGFDKEFWANAGHEARFAAAWEMINEVRLIRGENNVRQSGLQRSVQNIKRRGS